MPITVLLELKFKTESLAEAREVFRRELVKTRAFDGNLVTDVLVDSDDESHWVIYESWASVEDDDAYRRFRAGRGYKQSIVSVQNWFAQQTAAELSFPFTIPAANCQHINKIIGRRDH